MQKSETSVDAFLAAIENPRRREDAEALVALMLRVTGQDPVVWGNIIGFDAYHYKYESGREGDSFVVGFSPRKQNLVVYITNGFEDYGPLLKKIGKHKSSVSCLYINKLADVDQSILEELVSRSYKDMKAKYHTAPTRA